MSVDRFHTPLYGIGEAAGYLAIPASTLATWAYGYERRGTGVTRVTGQPVVTAVRPPRRHQAAMPFIGLAEAYALAAFRQAGVPMQRIRPAIDVLHRELGLQYALASRRLYADRRRSSTTTPGMPTGHPKASGPASWSWSAATLDGDLARAEPKTLRYRVLHAAGRLARGGRSRILKIAATWPWAQEIITAWQRIQAVRTQPDQQEPVPPSKEGHPGDRGPPAARPDSRARVLPRA